MQSELFYYKSLDCSLAVYLVNYLCFIEISVFNASSVKSDQAPCLIWVYTIWQSPFYRHKWVNVGAYGEDQDPVKFVISPLSWILNSCLI